VLDTVAQRTIGVVLMLCKTDAEANPAGAGPIMPAEVTAPVNPDQFRVYVRIRVSREYQMSIVPSAVEGVCGTFRAPVRAILFFLNSVILVNSVSRLHAVSKSEAVNTKADNRRNFMSS
jgi:hypothetical protein